LNDIGHNRAGGMNSRESDDSFLDIDNDQGGFLVECGDWHGLTKFAIRFPSIIHYAGSGKSWRDLGTEGIALLSPVIGAFCLQLVWPTAVSAQAVG
jgi:hypothetical protein